MKKIVAFYGSLFLALCISLSAFSAEATKAEKDEITMPERFRSKEFISVFDEAIKYNRAREYAKAADEFRKIIKNNSEEKDILIQSNLLLGDALLAIRQKGNIEIIKEAKSAYENILKLIPPDGKEYQYFWGITKYKIAEADIRLDERAVALENLKLLIDSYAEKKVAPDVAKMAINNLWECFALEKNKQNHLELLNQLWNKYQKTKLAPAILFQMANYYAREDKEKAKEIYNQVITSFPDSIEARWAQSFSKRLDESEKVSKDRESKKTPEAEHKEPDENYEWINEGGPYGGYINSVAIAAKDPNIIYAGGSNGLHKSNDGAENWKPVTTLHDNGFRFDVDDVEVDPSDSNVIYVAGYSLYKSIDGSISWKRISPDSASSISSIEIDQKNPKILYLLDAGKGVYKSIDGGETWELKNNGLTNPRCWHMYLDRNFPQVLCCITQSKQAVYKSQDSGKTWEKESGKIKDISIGPLNKNPDNPTEFIITVNHNGENVYIYREGTGSKRVSGGSQDIWVRQLILDPENKNLASLIINQYYQSDVFITADGGGYMERARSSV
jgi:tetratricopeptide (TPR) repeat protein